MEIKLEVGKTYIDRSGASVRIMEVDSCGDYVGYVYGATCVDWYAEDGRREDFGIENYGIKGTDEGDIVSVKEEKS